MCQANKMKYSCESSPSSVHFLHLNLTFECALDLCVAGSNIDEKFKRKCQIQTQKTSQ